MKKLKWGAEPETGAGRKGTPLSPRPNYNQRPGAGTRDPRPPALCRGAVYPRFLAAASTPHTLFPTPYSPLPPVLGPTPHSSLRLCVSFFLTILLLLSCASTPKAGAPLADGSPDFSILPPGANVYLWINVDQAKPLLEALPLAAAAGSDASRVMDMTDTAIAALYPEDASRRFFLAGWGDYPNIKAGVSMGFSRNWKKTKSETGKRYWYSKSSKLGVALSSSVAFVSDGDPFSPGSSADPAPGGYEEFRRSCVLSGWMEEPAVPLNRFMDELGIPIQIPAEDFFFGAVSVPAASAPAASEQAASASVPAASGQAAAASAAAAAKTEAWEFRFKIRTQSAAQARSLLTLFTMARFFLGRGGGTTQDASSPEGTSAEKKLDLARQILANPPQLDGEFLSLKTGALDTGGMALLFSMFPLNSNGR